MTPEAQATAVELAEANLRGHCENLERLIRLKKRSQAELDTARLTLPALIAAAQTMRRWADKCKEKT